MTSRRNESSGAASGAIHGESFRCGVGDAYQDYQASRLLLLAARSTWYASIKTLAAGVEQVSGGDPAVIVTSGFSVRSPANPIGQLPPPANVASNYGAMAGQINLTWAPVRTVTWCSGALIPSRPRAGHMNARMRGRVARWRD